MTSFKNIDGSIGLVELFRSVHTIERFQNNPAQFCVNGPGCKDLDLSSDVSLFHISKLSFDKEFPRREAFENVLNTINNESFNFVYTLSGNALGVDLCIGVVKNHKKNIDTLSTANYGDIVESAFNGNFSGSSMKKMTVDDLKKFLIDDSRKFRSGGVVFGIPSINENESGETLDFQGIDRLVNTMLGQTWRIVVVCEPVGNEEISFIRECLYDLYNRLAPYSKRSLQNSLNEGLTASMGDNYSDSKSHDRSTNTGYNDTKGRANSSGTENSSRTDVFSRNESRSRSHSEGENRSVSINKGSSQTITTEMANKRAQDYMEYIEDDLLPRLKKGFSKGLFKTSMYYMADKVSTANKLKVSIISLFQGNKMTMGPLSGVSLDFEDPSSVKMIKAFQNGYHALENISQDAVTLLGRPVDPEYGLGFCSFLTSSEISLLAGLPQHEVPGIILNEAVDFGLNLPKDDSSKLVDLGVLVQKDQKLNIRFTLNKDSLTKHIFVAGVTGSGKTTTCHRLLLGAKIPFLVIEPAKTEYRTLINNKKFNKVYVFTLGNESVAPFRINPFELIPGEVISAHIDMVKATFASAFTMEASMPQILEEAIVRCYEKKGWNLDTNENEMYDAPFDGDKEDAFPILSDLLEEMKSIVKIKGFGDRMEADYIGSLVSRLSNLTVGAKGRMLNCPYSVDFRFIAQNNVVLEMDQLKSPEDKALLMGFILARISVVIRKEHENDPTFRHLTLVEEAHRLLSKVEYGDSGAKKSAVESFTDLLAEVRKYGESLVVVDQIPNKLAPEVLKNTNTKIIHKILARDDKEAVGDTMLMDEKQKEYLSALKTGYAIVFSEDMEKPVHVYIERETNTNEPDVLDVLVKNLFVSDRKKLGDTYKNLEVMKIYNLFKQFVENFNREKFDEDVHHKFVGAIKNLDVLQGISTQNACVCLCRWFRRTERRSKTAEELEKMIKFLFSLIDGKIDTYKGLTKDFMF